MTAPADPDRLIGQTIGGRYIVDRRIGAGGMGTVFLAKQTPIGRQVALKVLLPQFAGDDGMSRRFEQEARAVSLLNHPNIVTIHDFGRTDDGIVYIAMEYLEGVTIRQILKERGGIPWEEANSIALGVGQALAEAHAHGIIHRDLKADNVMLVQKKTGEQIVKVLDFGLAKAVGDPSFNQEQTQANFLIGTPFYMSPEQIQGLPLDGRADLYSLGILWWEMLVGRRPIEGAQPVQTLMAHLQQFVPPPSAQMPNAAIPQETDDLVLSLLAKDRTKRIQSADHLVAALRGPREMSGPNRAAPSARMSGGYTSPFQIPTTNHTPSQGYPPVAPAAPAPRAPSGSAASPAPVAMGAAPQRPRTSSGTPVDQLFGNAPRSSADGAPSPPAYGPQPTQPSQRTSGGYASPFAASPFPPSNPAASPFAAPIPSTSQKPMSGSFARPVGLGTGPFGAGSAPTASGPFPAAPRTGGSGPHATGPGNPAYGPTPVTGSSAAPFTPRDGSGPAASSPFGAGAPVGAGPQFGAGAGPQFGAGAGPQFGSGPGPQFGSGVGLQFGSGAGPQFGSGPQSPAPSYGQPPAPPNPFGAPIPDSGIETPPRPRTNPSVLPAEHPARQATSPPRPFPQRRGSPLPIAAGLLAVVAVGGAGWWFLGHAPPPAPVVVQDVPHVAGGTNPLAAALDAWRKSVPQGAMNAAERITAAQKARAAETIDGMKRADLELKAALVLAPDDVEALGQWATNLADLGEAAARADLALAEGAVAYAMQGRPDEPALLRAAGALAHAVRGDPAAMSALSRAKEKTPKDPTTLRYYAATLLDLDATRAKDLAHAARAAAPQSTLVGRVLGSALLRTSDLKGARDLLEHRLKVEPNDEVALRELALVDVEDGKPDVAVRRLTVDMTKRSAQPRTARTRLLLAKIAYQLADDEKRANAELSDMAQQQDGDARGLPVLAHLVHTRIALNKIELALPIADEALTKGNVDAPLEVAAARLFRIAGRPEDAAKALAAAARIASGSPAADDVALAQVDLLLSQGKHAEARKLSERVFASRPKDGHAYLGALVGAVLGGDEVRAGALLGFAENVHPAVPSDARTLTDYPVSPKDLAVFQAAIAADPPDGVSAAQVKAARDVVRRFAAGASKKR